MKQVIVIRKDLNMRKGKMIAQGAHASMGVFFSRIVPKMNPKIMPTTDEVTIKINPIEWNWINGTFTKICVGVDSLEELWEVHNKAIDLGIPSALIIDSGKTEFNGKPTETAVAIGPALDEDIDTITGHLKLL